MLLLMLMIIRCSLVAPTATCVTADISRTTKPAAVDCALSVCRYYEPGKFVSVNLPSREGAGRGDA
jgi:hypothetical protein